MTTKKDFQFINPEDLENHILEALRTDLEIGYTVRFKLADKFTYLKLMGHNQPFERIGDILNEMNHWIEYTYPGHEVGLFFYDDLIENVLWYCNRDRSKAGTTSFDYAKTLGYIPHFEEPTCMHNIY